MNAKISVFLFVLKQSYFYYIICMTVPLNVKNVKFHIYIQIVTKLQLPFEIQI